MQHEEQISMHQKLSQKRSIKREWNSTGAMSSIFSSKNSEYSLVWVKSSSNLLNCVSLRSGASSHSTSSSFILALSNFASSSAIVFDTRDDPSSFTSAINSSSNLNSSFGAQTSFPFENKGTKIKHQSKPIYTKLKITYTSINKNDKVWKLFCNTKRRQTTNSIKIIVQLKFTLHDASHS